MITDIANRIKQAFIDSPLLWRLYGLDANKTFDEQFSPVAMEALTIEAHATAGAAIETMHEWHLQETTRIVEKERYGYAGWYAKMMRLFQFSTQINYDYSENSLQFGEGTLYDNTGLTPEEIEELRIIKFAFAFDNLNVIGVTIKIAKAHEQTGEPIQLVGHELTAATSYINRIKPAGIPIKIINEPAEELYISVKITYDPLSFDSEGEFEERVEDAINTYLKGIKFNGEFVSMRMIDQLQVTRGIAIAMVDKIFVNRLGYLPEDITGLMSYIPTSGAMKLGILDITKEAM